MARGGGLNLSFATLRPEKSLISALICPCPQTAGRKPWCDVALGGDAACCGRFSGS